LRKRNQDFLDWIKREKRTWIRAKLILPEMLVPLSAKPLAAKTADKVSKHSLPGKAGDDTVDSICVSAAVEYRSNSKLYGCDDLSDFTIETAETTTFRCHSSVIAVSSPVFMAMLKSGMTESQTRVVSLPTTSATIVNVFLKLAYGVGASITRNDLFPLAEFADKYDVDCIGTAISSWISATDLDTIEGRLLLRFFQPPARGLLKPKVQSRLATYACRRLHAWQFQDWFLTSKADDIGDFFNAIGPVSWFQFVAIDRWINHDAVSRKQFATLLLTTISADGFKHFTSTELTSISQSPLISNSTAVSQLFIDELVLRINA
jgi:hypothetical protein